VLDTNWQALTEHSEQQKQEMRGLLDKAMEEAKESQIDREIKMKMWDALVKSLTAQQRVSLIDKFRGQVNDAERSRINAQMQSSYDQM
jgi:type II secretory pathway component HofQ